MFHCGCCNTGCNTISHYLCVGKGACIEVDEGEEIFKGMWQIMI